MILLAIIAACGLLAFATAWIGHRSVDRTVTQPYVERDLTAEEIRTKLRSPDFKERLEASKQIDKLGPEEKLRVLLRLAEAPEAPARLLAARKLRSMEAAAAREKLSSMAKDDPDADVREVAGEPQQ